MFTSETHCATDRIKRIRRGNSLLRHSEADVGMPYWGRNPLTGAIAPFRCAKRAHRTGRRDRSTGSTTMTQMRRWGRHRPRGVDAEGGSHPATSIGRGTGPRGCRGAELRRQDGGRERHEPSAPLPFTPGSGLAGTVVGLGDTVVRFAEGDRVVVRTSGRRFRSPRSAATSTRSEPLTA